jgi:hypothetical protein
MLLRKQAPSLMNPQVLGLGGLLTGTQEELAEGLTYLPNDCCSPGQVLQVQLRTEIPAPNTSVW